MDTNNFYRLYLPLLLERFKLIEEEIETHASYMTEENFNEFFDDYKDLQTSASDYISEIFRTGKRLGMSKKKIQRLLEE